MQFNDKSFSNPYCVSILFIHVKFLPNWWTISPLHPKEHNMILSSIEPNLYFHVNIYSPISHTVPLKKEYTTLSNNNSDNGYNKYYYNTDNVFEYQISYFQAHRNMENLRYTTILFGNYLTFSGISLLEYTVAI
mgnify:CR=1 FL=1